MMDIVERLRERGHPMSLGGDSLFNPDGEEAAAEIERLRKRDEACEKIAKTASVEIAKRDAELARLRAENDGLRKAVQSFAADETTMARRLRTAVVEARHKLAIARATWNGAIHQADNILSNALYERAALSGKTEDDRG